MVLRMNTTGNPELIIFFLLLICIPTFMIISAASASDDFYNVYCDWVSDSGGSCCVIMKTTDPRSPALSSQEFSGGVTYNRAMERLTELTAAGLGRDCEYGTSMQADNTRWSIFCDRSRGAGRPGVGCCVVGKTAEPPSASYTLTEFSQGVPLIRAMERLNDLSAAGTVDYCGYGAPIRPTPTGQAVPTRSVTPEATAPPDSDDDPLAVIQGFIEQILSQIERLLGGGILPWGPSPTPYPSGDLYEIQPKVGPMKNM